MGGEREGGGGEEKREGREKERREGGIVKERGRQMSEQPNQTDRLQYPVHPHCRLPHC